MPSRKTGSETPSAMRILLIGARLCRNLGGPSLLVATRMVLSERFPHAEYRLLVPAASAAEDSALEDVYKVRCTPYRPSPLLAVVCLLRLLGIRVKPHSLRQVIDAFEESDVVIDIWGIGFSDSIGGRSARSRFAAGLHFLLARALRKPVIKYTADYGPMRSFWNRFFTRAYLRHCVDLVFARDEDSRDAVASLGVRTPLYVYPDTAFLLEPEPSALASSLSDVRRTQPIVGISVSHQIRNRSAGTADYVALIAHLADHMVSSLGARVLLIPNELSSLASADDAGIARAVQERMTNPSAAFLVSECRSASELKGVIRQCDAIVAARYHTLVAALSMGIPSLAIGWHHKYEGLLSLVGQERFAYDFRTLTDAGLQSAFAELWSDREAIKATISSRLPEVKQRIAEGADRVRDLLVVKGYGVER